MLIKKSTFNARSELNPFKTEKRPTMAVTITGRMWRFTPLGINASKQNINYIYKL